MRWLSTYPSSSPITIYTLSFPPTLPPLSSIHKEDQRFWKILKFPYLGYINNTHLTRLHTPSSHPPDSLPLPLPSIQRVTKLAFSLSLSFGGWSNCSSSECSSSASSASSWVLSFCDAFTKWWSFLLWGVGRRGECVLGDGGSTSIFGDCCTPNTPCWGGLWARFWRRAFSPAVECKKGLGSVYLIESLYRSDKGSSTRDSWAAAHQQYFVTTPDGLLWKLKNSFCCLLLIATLCLLKVLVAKQQTTSTANQLNMVIILKMKKAPQTYHDKGCTLGGKGVKLMSSDMAYCNRPYSAKIEPI